MADAAMTPRDYLTIAQRYKWFLLLPATAIFFLAVFVALLWPPSYKSTATILIEQAEIPPELIGGESGQVTDFVERRIDAISKRVMVSDNLSRIINQYNLYADDRAKRPLSDVIDDMRDKITLDIVTTNVVAQNGTASTSAVAFTLDFVYRDPAVAQRVTNELVSLYLNENLKQRRERATQTAIFLTQERQRADQEVSELSRQLDEFRKANAGALPETALFNQQAIMRLEQQMTDYSGQLQSLREREAYGQQQLASMQPYEMGMSGGMAMSPEGQLISMRTDLATLRGRYGPDHPDVRRLARQVVTLQESQGGEEGTTALAQQQDTAQRQLDQLLQRYTPEHPDVQRARRTLDGLNAQLAASKARGKDSQPDNPAYIEAQATLQGVKSQIPGLTEQLKTANRQLEQLQLLSSKTPAIQGQYDKLQKSIEDATVRRDDLAQREMTATLGQSVETELKGERFALIEPPDLPTSAHSPNRLLIVVLGVVLAAGAGGGAATLSHVLNDGIYSSRDVAAIIGEPPLSVIPHISTRLERMRVWSMRLLYGLAVLVLCGGVAWLVDTRIKPLDVMAYGLMQSVRDSIQSLSASPQTPPSGQ